MVNNVLVDNQFNFVDFVNNFNFGYDPLPNFEIPPSAVSFPPHEQNNYDAFWGMDANYFQPFPQEFDWNSLEMGTSQLDTQCAPSTLGAHYDYSSLEPTQTNDAQFLSPEQERQLYECWQFPLNVPPVDFGLGDFAQVATEGTVESQGDMSLPPLPPFPQSEVNGLDFICNSWNETIAPQVVEGTIDPSIISVPHKEVREEKEETTMSDTEENVAGPSQIVQTAIRPAQSKYPTIVSELKAKVRFSPYASPRPRAYTCDFCGARFSASKESERICQRHMKIHDEDREVFMCGGSRGCGNIYSRSDAFRRHERHPSAKCKGKGIEVAITSSEYLKKYPENATKLQRCVMKRKTRIE